MRITTIIICLLGGTINLCANAAESLDFLNGNWSGPGSLSGSETIVHQHWGPTLNGAFTNLRHQIHLVNENGQVLVFEGVGYYKKLEENSLVGVWIGSNGDIHPLKATVESQTLTVEWGDDDGESGRSIYQVRSDGSLKVVDSVEDANGGSREFASAILVPQ